MILVEYLLFYGEFLNMNTKIKGMNHFLLMIFSMYWSSASRMPTYLGLASSMWSHKVITSAPNFLAEAIV